MVMSFFGVNGAWRFLSSTTAMLTLHAYAPPAFAQDAANNTAEATEVDEIVVEGLRFKFDDATSALKLPISVKDTPQTVTVVTRDVISFASIKAFEDVYKIDASGSTTHALDSFPRNSYRGFIQQGNNTIRVDGFRMPADLQLDLAPYERFEIVKGATSTLYGQNSVGGTLNAISKLPQAGFGGEVILEAGTFDQYRGTFDAYGSLTSDDSLQFRVVGSALDAGAYNDIGYHRSLTIAPTIKYDLGPNTSLIARVNYQDHRFRYHFGHGLQFVGADLSAPVRGDFRIADDSRSLFSGQEWNRAEKDALLASVTMEHEFGNGWKLRANAQNIRTTEYSTAELETLILGNGDVAFSYLYTNEKESELYAGEINLFGDIEVLGTRNTLFLGADYYQLNESILQGAEFATTGFNVFNPDYTLTPARRAVADYPNFTNIRQDTKGFGFTAQLFLRPVDGLTLILGGRYSREKTKRSIRFGTVGDNVTSFEDYFAQPFDVSIVDVDDFTIQAGATYAVTEHINLYGSFGQTFEPKANIRIFEPGNPAGSPGAPELGEAIEAGIKGEFLNRKVSATLAVFDMKRTNVAQGDQGNPGFSVLLGEQRSRGVELEVQGQFLPGWNTFLSAAYVDSKFTAGEFKGLQPSNAPKFGLSVFSSYEFKAGPLNGFGIGAGVVHKGGRESFASDLRYSDGGIVVTDFGGYTEVDARLFYRVECWKFDASVTNVFNEKYYSPVRNDGTYGINVNPPRTFMLSIERTF